MEQVEKWAEFVRNNPREKWKKVINVFVDSVYQKSRDFYVRLEKTKEGREILNKLREDRFKGAQKTLF